MNETDIAQYLRVNISNLQFVFQELLHTDLSENSKEELQYVQRMIDDIYHIYALRNKQP